MATPFKQPLRRNEERILGRKEINVTDPTIEDNRLLSWRSIKCHDYGASADCANPLQQHV